MAKRIKPASKKTKDKVDYIDRRKALKRIHREGFMVNDKELEAIEAYCKKYKINNKSKFLRETILRYVMEQFLEDYPTLFEKQDLDRLRV